MKMFIVMFLASFSLSAMAATARCEGVHRGVRIIVNAQGNPANTRAGTGSISVGGRRVAVFDGDQLSVNYLMRSMRVANDHGDRAEARMTNIRTGAGIITRLVVPAFGIDYRNVPVVCSMR